MKKQMSLMMNEKKLIRMSVPVLAQEREIMALGKTNHWNFRVLGAAPVPDTAVYVNNWWLVPLAEDKSQIPARALERVRSLYAAGIRPKAFVIAHEAPKQIAPPPETPIVSPLAYWSQRAAHSSVAVLKGVGAVAAAVVPLMVKAVGLSLLAGLTLGTLLADPCLIAVTDDDVWIEIDSWMN